MRNNVLIRICMIYKDIYSCTIRCVFIFVSNTLETDLMYTLFVFFGTDRSSVDETPTRTRAFE